MTRRRKKPGPAPVVTTDPESIEFLRLYDAADEWGKAAIRRTLNRMVEGKMPLEMVIGLFWLELGRADPNYIAAWRRQRLRPLR